MSDLPRGWVATNLGDAIDYGKTEKVDPSELTDSDWVLELEDIEKNSSRLLQRLTFKQRNSKSTKNRFQTGDVLYGKLRPTLNKIILADAPGVCTSEITPLRPPEGISPQYIFYALKRDAFLEYVASVNHGMDMPRLGTQAGRDAPLPLAPTKEQHRIVAKLNSLTARSSRARRELDRIPTLIARYKQAILAKAFSGELTESLRTSEGSEEGLPSSWCWETVQALAADLPRAIQSGPFGSNLLHSEFRSTGRLVIGIDNVQNGYFSPGSQNRISEAKFSELEKYRARAGDVLITVMATVGRTCVVPDDIEPAIITKHVYRISPDRSRVDPSYLMNALRGSEAMLEQMGANIRGQTRPGINGAILKALRVPLAPIAEQLEIVRRIDSAFAWLDKIATEHARAAALLPKLDQAILAKAFRGELVAQNPNDEPASELLARLSAERSPDVGTKRNRRAVK